MCENKQKSKPTNTLGFWVCLLVSIFLFVTGFFIPPIGVIDGSVLKAVGMLLGFGTISQLRVLVRELESGKISAGDVTIEVEGKKPNKS